MYGNNPLRKVDHASDGRTLAVHSIFNTIQGEGPFAGRAATFVRLHGCHLACHFCDTDFESVEMRMSVEDIVRRCTENRQASLVVLTGGEPMRQNIARLCAALPEEGFTVQVETAGTLWHESWRAYFGHRVQIVVSPKGPKVHDGIAMYANAWKYLISTQCMTFDPDDGLPITNTQDKSEGAHARPLARPPAHVLRVAPNRVYVQPLDEGSTHKNLSNVKRCVELSLKYGYSLSLQQHKIVGVP